VKFFVSLGMLHAAAEAAEEIDVSQRPPWQAMVAFERGDEAGFKKAVAAADALGTVVHIPWPEVIAHYAMKTGEAAWGRKTLEQLNEIDPDIVEGVRYSRATLLIADHRPAEAIPLLEEAVQHASILRQWYLFGASEELAEAYEQTGRLDDAIRTLEPLERDHRFEEEFMLAPTHARYHLWQLYRKAGRLQDAAKIESEFRELSRFADPDHPYLAQFRQK
jgi:tetratricopeptide (TPR) repeat protein